jgi:hypothetical protein
MLEQGALICLSYDGLLMQDSAQHKRGVGAPDKLGGKRASRRARGIASAASFSSSARPRSMPCLVRSESFRGILDVSVEAQVHVLRPQRPTIPLPLSAYHLEASSTAFDLGRDGNGNGTAESWIDPPNPKQTRLRQRPPRRASPASNERGRLVTWAPCRRREKTRRELWPRSQPRSNTLP